MRIMAKILPYTVLLPTAVINKNSTFLAAITRSEIDAN